MSEGSKLLELEMEMLDITRRLDRLSGDYSNMSSSLKTIQDDLGLVKGNLNRFFEHEWPAVDKAITQTNRQLGDMAEAAVAERIKAAVHAVQLVYESKEREKESLFFKQEIAKNKAEMERQKNTIIKIALIALASGGAGSAVIQGLSALLGG
jgi:hypothetical protein